jgi:hypothetical protein
MKITGIPGTFKAWFTYKPTPPTYEQMLTPAERAMLKPARPIPSASDEAIVGIFAGLLGLTTTCACVYGFVWVVHALWRAT